jgi:hypothetical protein
MGLETVVLEKGGKKGEVFGKVGLEDRTGKKDVKFIPEGEGTVGTVPIGVREKGDRGGIVMMGREGTVLTTETK